MTKRWEDIILGISLIKPQYVHKERILNMLKYDYTADLQVLDNLYEMQTLTLQEYQEYLKKLLEREKSHGLETQIKERLKDSEDKKDKFTTLIYYALAFNSGYYGQGLSEKISEIQDCSLQNAEFETEGNN